MAISIEFLIAIGWITLIIGFIRRDYTLTTLPSLYLMVIGTFILTSDTFGLTQMVKLGLGLLHIGTGFYVGVRSGLETYKGKKLVKPKFIRKKKENKEENTEEENNGEEN